MNSPNICDICNQEKTVCCGFEGKDPKDRYCYCKECCPNAAEHIISKQRREKEEKAEEEYIPSTEERFQKLEDEIIWLKDQIKDIQYRYVMRDDIDE